MSNTKKVGSILRTRCWAGMRGIRSLFRLSRPNVDDDEKGFSAFSLLLAAKKAFMFQIRKKTNRQYRRTRPVISKNTEINKGW